MTDIYTFLNQHSIPYRKFEHPPVFTCEEAQRLCPDMPGVATKNLFLRDKDGKRHFLVIVGHQKSVDLNGLKATLDVSKLSFASEERLSKYLGLTPGSVTLLGLINDPEGSVEVIIDEALLDRDLQCHPLVNTATLSVSADGVRKFLAATGHQVRIMNVPVR